MGDYCYAPYQKAHYGVTGCTPTKKCRACAGDCDRDADCKTGLKCYQRNGKTLTHGCKAGGAGDVNNWDYCYNPSWLHTMGWSGCTPAKRCNACQGDCDGDRDCKTGLKCFQRNAKQAVKGCIANFAHNIANYDFCYKAPPAVRNCVGRWRPYTSCSKGCGWGKRTRSYQITRQAGPGGRACRYKDGQVQTSNCRLRTCPRAQKGCPTYHPTHTRSKGGSHVTPVVTQTGYSVSAGATFELALKLRGDARSVYAIAGTSLGPLVMPPAYQSSKSSNVGAPAAVFNQPNDSYLTVGLKDNGKKLITAKGISFNRWNAKTQLHADSGAVFWMNPKAAPKRSNKPVLVAQVTVKVPCSKRWSAMMGVTGYRNNGKAWRNNNVVFAWNKFTMTKKCPGDISMAGKMVPDGKVNVEDLLSVLANFGCNARPGGNTNCNKANVMAKGGSKNRVDVEDLLLVLSRFGVKDAKCP